MIIDIVKPEEWSQIEGAMKAVFHNDMPVTPDQAVFVGLYDEGRLAGWVHVEHLYHFNCVYLDVPYRQSGLGLKLIKEAASRIPAGHSAICIANRGYAVPIARALGARDLGIQRVFRKDT